MRIPTRWTQLPKHVSDSTTQVSQDHAATGVLLVLGINNHQSLPENAAEKPTRAATGLHQSDRSHTPVRPVPAGAPWQNLRTSTEGSYTGSAGVARWSDRSKPGNPKSTNMTFQAPNWIKLETTATQDNRELTNTFTRAKSNWGLAPVRPVRGTSQTSVT
jgi:hypothetical protein